MKRCPTAINLFSGAGGFSLDVEQAGLDDVAAHVFVSNIGRQKGHKGLVTFE